ncbi:Hypothetical protein PHPALM_17471 [Phytophthora palmivora]|uniref:BZIP domain-containing protein n=1 Tax=Phytophthora palmivora TaxID=4796 RepID=A0A2P4XMB0_9STRA|nr:Hypothetical protein PHPALM_17471 [Phytophthora palmivora]
MTSEDHQKPRANVQRSLSEDIVNMLDDSNETNFSKETDQRGNAALQNMLFNPGGQNMMSYQHQASQHQLHSNHIQQYQQQQMQVQQQVQQQQQQYQQQQQQFQQAAGSTAPSWMNSFGGGNQTNATTNASASGQPSNPSAHRRLSNPTNPTALDIAVAEGTASLVADYPASQVAATSLTSVASSTPSTLHRATSSSSDKEKPGVTGTQASTPSTNGTTSGDAKKDTAPRSNDTNMNDPSQQVNGFGPQGMMMNPFMLYSMMGPQGMNMMGMPMQMPMGMNMNGMNGMNSGNGMNGSNGNGGNGANGINNMNGMNGIPLPMQMQLQLQLQMQMAQMAQMNGMSGMNGMQMPMGLPGMPMGMNMPMPMSMNMQQQVNPQSSGDVEMASAFSMGTPSAGGSMLKPARTLQPKGVQGGPAFVNIARKPEEPEVSSILKSLMDEEAKKKEKKLERNRDSARESRRKQQTYVETLENGIKRLQINRDLNPANFQSLMRLNRQRRTLAMQHEERERAVWKSFVFVGRQLAAMRTRVLQKLQLQCYAQQMFNEEVLELTKLFKIFFALRNEAIRLNMMSPSLERYFREVCSFDQLQKLLQWTENHRTVIETDLSLDEV